MGGVKRLLDSSTFALGVLVNVGWYLASGAWSVELLSFAVGAYGVKEGGRRLGEGQGRRSR